MPDEFDPNHDPWAGTTGLKDNFDGNIVEAGFYREPQRDNYSIQLTIKADDGDDVELRYGVGGEWASYDGGETVEHPRAWQFNNRSAYFAFVKAALECMKGEGKILRSRGEQAKDDKGRPLGPRSSAVWVGLRFHFNVFEIAAQRKDQASGEWTDKNTDGTPFVIPRTLPTAFWGEVGGKQGALPLDGAGSVAAPAPSVPASPSAAPTSNASTPTFSPTDEAKIKLLASAMTYPQFVDAIMGMQLSDGTDMMSSPHWTAVSIALSDEAWYSGLKGA